MQHNYKNVQLALCSILYLPLFRQPTVRALVRNSASPTRSTRSHRIHSLRTRSWVNLTENGWSGFQIKKILEETCWYNRAKHAPAAPSVSFLTRRTASSVRPIRCVLVALATGAPQWGGTELLHPWYLRAWFCSSFVCSSPYLSFLYFFSRRSDANSLFSNSDKNRSLLESGENTPQIEFQTISYRGSRCPNGSARW